METALKKLPLEIQTLIREELPNYSQLSKKYHAGEKRLPNLCMKPISKKEFIDYIYVWQFWHRKKFMFYTEYNDYYHIYEVTYDNNHYYDILIHSLDLHNLKIIRDKERIYDLEDYIENFENITFDLFITNHIILLRKKCDVNQYLQNELYKHINMDNQLNQIKTCLYIVSNAVLIDKKPFSIFTGSLKFEMDHNREELDQYLIDIYNKVLLKLQLYFKI